MAQDMLDKLTKYEKDRAEYEKQRAEFEEVSKLRPTGPGTITADTVLDRPQDPWADLRAALRKPGAGETQIMATLVRIDCEVKNIIFVLQTPAGLLRLTTRRFEDAEIVTYTTDMKGDISCGPRKPVNAVVVAYTPNTNKRVKSDGVLKSVEFVPADFKLKPDKK